MYEVKMTVRSRACDKNAPIDQLIADQNVIETVEKWKPYADRSLLCVRCKHTGKLVLVYIYWSQAYGRWVATTERDGLECNNLLSLPICKVTNKVGSTSYFDTCPI